MSHTKQRPKYKNTAIYKGLAYLLLPIYDRVKHYLLVKKWRHHAFEGAFNWNWSGVNFNRIALVNLLLSKKENGSYLEIGCASNTLFDSVPTLNKVGVDPESGGNVRLTSDDFFKQNHARFDVIFIDGLHTYQQIRKDIINSISALNKDGFIALHDMLPQNWMEHHVPNVFFGPWTGDVWKVAFELINTPGIEFKILKIDHGVGVIKVRPEYVTLQNLTSQLENQEFSYLFNNIHSLPIVEWSEAQQWLRE